MITLHHLEYSQSFRILWLLEELGTEYELKLYNRNADNNLAPDAYKALSPLGTAPVITDENGLVLAESNAVIDYILDQHPDSPLRPAGGSPERADYLFWFHASIGSMMPMQFMDGIFTVLQKRSPFFLRPVISAVLGQAQKLLVQPRMTTILDRLEHDLARHKWLAGDQLTAADITMSYCMASAKQRGFVNDSRPGCMRWLEQMEATPSYQSAMAKDGRETMVFSFD
ncbi:glutathione S-transferase [Parasphingorhabdus marina DSM 22363]|uniref:Glutathione S-transferase n=1 Tax=Parasphingorhabdus marina DSM 22363 TaxID=1123272 RepID=A0A1N6CN18_9SPHN|nr:glutathione S-transferase family protein [Parasphingorhabdus marina]SIN59887.1 glutathione S-transferase [Parasphingorhabdus marina DSM 22363]